jgi:rubrerythrin
MYKDEIIEEIHQYREEYAKSFNYDLRAIFDDLKKKQIAHEHKVVKLPIKRYSNKPLQPIAD